MSGHMNGLPMDDRGAASTRGRVEISDVVDAILFLESSPYITGEILHVDGGQTAGR